MAVPLDPVVVKGLSVPMKLCNSDTVLVKTKFPPLPPCPVVFLTMIILPVAGAGEPEWVFLKKQVFVSPGFKKILPELPVPLHSVAPVMVVV